jgi:hypothetical protein
VPPSRTTCGNAGAAGARRPEDRTRRPRRPPQPRAAVETAPRIEPAAPPAIAPGGHCRLPRLRAPMPRPETIPRLVRPA